MEYTDHDDFVAILVEFMNDDVRQARHGPFIGTGDDPDPTELGEFAEPIGLGKDAFGNVDCRLGAPLFYIKADAGNVRERFEREAHLHMVIDGLSL
jgi:hypothetical protein